MRSIRLVGMLPVLGLLMAGLVAFAPGCSSDDGKKVNGTGGAGGSSDGGAGGGGSGGGGPASCETSDDCEIEERCDAATKVCVPRCTSDNECPANTGTRCDIDAGECIPGEPCTDDFTCGTDRGHDYCKEAGDCVCAPDSSMTAPATGVCWRVAATCQPCGRSFECGNTDVFGTKKADCRSFPVDGEMMNVCLPQSSSRCPAGMVPMDLQKFPDLDGYCMPQNADCASMAPCESNEECLDPSTPVCDLVRQICIPGCSVDVSTGSSVGCSADKVCHATTAGSNPELLDQCETAGTYGLGVCDRPCVEDTDCKSIDGVDPTFVCRNDGSGKRCRPAGCIDDSECTSGPGGIYTGFCNVGTGECVDDRCRAGIDPRTGCGSDKAFIDCSQQYKCVETPGTLGLGTCEKKDCIDKGGANLGCNFGQFCAGEAFKSFQDGSVQNRTVESPDGTPPGECFDMEVNTWCENTCESNVDCKVAAPTSYPDSPALCMDAGRGPTCLYGCDFPQDCPSGWRCDSEGLELECAGLQTCVDDEDCGGGSRCVDPIVRDFPGDFQSMEPFKVCECTDSNACGGGFSCNAGLGTMAVAPSEPNFQKVQARYCADSSACGSKGSCEWFGRVIPESPAGPAHARFLCGATPSDFAGPERVECPAKDVEAGLDVRKGKNPSDKYNCVYSQICQPGYIRQGEDLFCGVLNP